MDELCLEAAVVPPCQVEPKFIIRCCLFSGQTGSIRAVRKQTLKDRIQASSVLLGLGWVVAGLAHEWQQQTHR